MKLFKSLISVYLICFFITYGISKPRMKEIVNHLTWNLIKCDSSEILWSLKNCVNVVKKHMTTSDAKDGCLFLHYVSSCAKQMKSKVSECEMTSKLDKSLELDSLEFLYSASYMLCKSKMADMKRIYTPVPCGQFLLNTFVNKIEAAIEMEHFVPKQAFDVKSYVCSKLREFLEGGTKAIGCAPRSLKKSAQHILDNILKCHLPYITRRKEFTFSEYDEQQNDSFFQQFISLSTTTTVKSAISALEESSIKPGEEHLVKTQAVQVAPDKTLDASKASKVLETLKKIINAIIYEVVGNYEVLKSSLDVANESLHDVGLSEVDKSKSVERNSVILPSALIHADLSLNASSENITEKEKSLGNAEGKNKTETKHENESQNVKNQLEKLIREQIVRHNKTEASAIASFASSTTPTTTSTIPTTSSTSTTISTTPTTTSTTPTTTSNTPSTTATRTIASSTTAPSTTAFSTIPSTTPSKIAPSTRPSTTPNTTPSTTVASTTPSTTVASTTPSTTVTSTTPSTTVASTTPSTTVASTTPSTTVASTTPSTTVTSTTPSATPSTTPSTTPSATSISSIVSMSTLPHSNEESENVIAGNANGKIIVINKHNTSKPAVSFDSTSPPNRNIVIEYKNRPKTKFVIEYNNRPKNKFVIEYKGRSKTRLIEIQQNIIDDSVEDKKKNKFKETKQNCSGNETGSECKPTPSVIPPQIELTRRPNPQNKPEVNPKNAIRSLQMNNSGVKNLFHGVQIFGLYFCLIIQFWM